MKSVKGVKSVKGEELEARGEPLARAGEQLTVEQ